ncbi:MAG TPA: peptide ABC transporter permease, partial [Bacillota bacterium]|nr:peptide ABC transporter permease [Bacillota bacterium]
MSKLWMFLRNHLLFTVALLLLICILFLALFGEYLPIVDEQLTAENHRTENGVLYTPPFEPSQENLFGSDHQGRDLLSLIIIGAKETLLIVLFITVLRYLVAIPLAYL